MLVVTLNTVLLYYIKVSNAPAMIIFNINLFFFQSFLNRGGFILTQAPLPETTVDLWTLCVDHDVKAIVVLTENSEVQSIIYRCQHVFVARSIRVFQSLSMTRMPRYNSNHNLDRYQRLFLGNTMDSKEGLFRHICAIYFNFR